MQDGRTRKLSAPETPSRRAFLARHAVTLVIKRGPAAGSEFPIERDATTLGRGPGVELVFDDDAMSREHAAFEAGDDGLRVRDLGSTNGIKVNGHTSLAAELKHGDEVEVGQHAFQVVIEPRSAAPRTYVLDE